MKFICTAILEFLIYVIWGMGGQNDNCSLKFFILISITPIYIYIYIYLLICFPKIFWGPLVRHLKVPKCSVDTMTIQSMKIAFRFTNHMKTTKDQGLHQVLYLTDSRKLLQTFKMKIGQNLLNSIFLGKN